MIEIKNGVVVRFGSRGFGFVLDPETKEQYFVHIEDVIGRKTLRTGDTVKFQVGIAKPGSRTLPAILVELISSPDRVDRKEQESPQRAREGSDELPAR
ncbi:MAG: cold shock domain-containing protein [Candidatus Acidiferrales bacterium]